MSSVEQLVIKLSNNFSEVIHINTINIHPIINWGGNGVGDRFANKKFNYTVLYGNNKTKLYSENLEDTIPKDALDKFKALNKHKKGIAGIFVHSKRNNVVHRPIRKNILDTVRKMQCVNCSSNNEIVCDHKNDFYNDDKVLNVDTQTLDDFQPLCNHCNLLKRQVSVKEKETQKLFSAKTISRYRIIPFLFPWEMKVYDISDPDNKKDTYWYDPIEFDRKVYAYMLYKYPILSDIKKFNKL
jgi:hypothetical protein